MTYCIQTAKPDIKARVRIIFFFFCRVQYDRINPNTILNSQSAVLFEFITLLVAKLLHLEVTFFITLNVQMLLN